jgi:hypothetical protein
MPFPKPLGHTSPYLRPAQVSRRAHAALNVLVQKTVFEPGEKRRSETVASEEGVGE